MTPNRLPLDVQAGSRQALRRKMVLVTSAFLTWGLEHYPSDQRIPTQRAGPGRLNRVEATAFWDGLGIR